VVCRTLLANVTERARRVLPAGMLALSATLSAAEASAQEPPTFRAGVDMVTLGVSVVDLVRDRPVDGLTAADFRVLEDGRPQTVSAVTHERRPVSLCVVLDASGSMAFDLRRQLARLTIDTLLGGLAPGDEVSAVVFRDRVEVRQPWTRVADLTSADWGDAPVGATALVDGVRAGLTLLDSARNPRHVVVVITDGFENSSRASLASLTTTRRQSEAAIYGVAIGTPNRAETAAAGAPVPIDAEVGVVPDVHVTGAGASRSALVQPPEVLPPPQAVVPPAPVPQPNLIERLVDEAGGILMRARSSAEAGQAARNILIDLATQYTLGYVPSRPVDGRYRRVKVELPGRGRGTFVRHRAGYLALPASAARPAEISGTATAAAPPAAPATDRATPAVPPPVKAGAGPMATPASGDRRDRYTRAVTAFHQERGFGEVQRLIGAWSRDELSAAVADVARAGERPLAYAAAVFHLEVARSSPVEAAGNADYHLTLGAHLLAPWVDPRAGAAPEFVERWHAAAVSVFLGQSDTPRARRVRMRAGEQIQQAATGDFLDGRIEEVEALRYDADLARDTSSAIAFNNERRMRLALAERAYREALKKDPARHRAAVHLGRVLWLLDRHDDARRTLEPIVSDENAAAGERYLASLFLAAEYERAGDVDRARTLLESIESFAPGRQTARLALAALEHRAGRVERARTIVEEAVPDGGPGEDDEWWSYRNGGVPEEDLAWLRQAASPRP
jgi:VWFA-related protein